MCIGLPVPRLHDGFEVVGAVRVVGNDVAFVGAHLIGGSWSAKEFLCLGFGQLASEADIHGNFIMDPVGPSCGSARRRRITALPNWHLTGITKPK